MPALLCSLGASWAVVPEAFHLPGTQFDAAHVLTSDTALRFGATQFTLAVPATA